MPKTNGRPHRGFCPGSARRSPATTALTCGGAAHDRSTDLGIPDGCPAGPPFTEQARNKLAMYITARRGS